MPVFRREDGKLEAVPGNYAILNEDGNVPIETIISSFEDYSNHNGKTDNFMSETHVGASSLTEDAPNHKMLMDGSATVGSYAIWLLKKEYSLDSRILVFNIIIDDIVLGASLTEKSMFLGIDNAWNTWSNGIWFTRYGNDTTWRMTTAKAGSFINHNVPITVVDGDLLTIVCDGINIKFMHNGAVVAQTNINFGVLTFQGGMYIGTNANVANTHSLSVDYVSIKSYYKD